MIKKSLTLIELVIVMVVLGILFTVVTPSSSTYLDTAKKGYVEGIRKNFESNFNKLYVEYLSDPQDYIDNSASGVFIKTGHLDRTGNQWIGPGEREIPILFSADSSANGLLTAVSPYDAAIGSWSQGEAACLYILEVFSQVPPQDIQGAGSSWSGKKWTIKPTAPLTFGSSTVCEYIYLDDESLGFTYDNSTGTIGDLS